MAIDESEITDLIASYEEYEAECESVGNAIGRSRAGLYRTIIGDLKGLLPHRTLADMTAKERQACIGMWCDVVGFTRPTPIVDMWNEEVELLTSNNLRGNIVQSYGVKEVTPRFDLLRAWSADGTPVEADIETGITF